MKTIILEDKVIALGKCAGKTVRAIAKVDPRDTFSPEVGEKLATARCEVKILEKRFKYADKQLAEKQKQLEEARQAYEAAENFLSNVRLSLSRAEIELAKVKESVK